MSGDEDEFRACLDRAVNDNPNGFLSETCKPYSEDDRSTLYGDCEVADRKDANPSGFCENSPMDFLMTFDEELRKALGTRKDKMEANFIHYVRRYLLCVTNSWIYYLRVRVAPEQTLKCEYNVVKLQFTPSKAKS